MSDSEATGATRKRTRGKRKDGAGSTVALSGETADRLDALVAHYRETSGWSVDRVAVVERLVRLDAERVETAADVADRLVRA